MKLPKLNPLAEKKGYEFICAVKCNAFYIRKRFYENT